MQGLGARGLFREGVSRIKNEKSKFPESPEEADPT